MTELDPFAAPPALDGRAAEEPAEQPPGLVLEPGDLVASWRVVLVITWALVVFSYSMVWKTSRELGIGTWWLGARSDPQPTVVSLVPFAVAIVFGVICSFRVKRLSIATIIGAFALAAIALPDFSRSIGLATIELLIAGAVLLIGIGSLAGVVQPSEP